MKSQGVTSNKSDDNDYDVENEAVGDGNGDGRPTADVALSMTLRPHREVRCASTEEVHRHQGRRHDGDDTTTTRRHDADYDVVR